MLERFAQFVVGAICSEVEGVVFVQSPLYWERFGSKPTLENIKKPLPFNRSPRNMTQKPFLRL
jgi:hypothetical protein